MAINDTINLNSSFDYFKLYNDENITLSSTATATETANVPLLSSKAAPAGAAAATTTATTIPSYVVTSSSSSTLPPPLSTIANNSSIIPLATATTLTITSTIINNNYTSHSHSNYNNSNTNHSSNNYTINSFNQSAYDQLRNLSDDNNININDSAKIAYESGSNFMLLLEDFGEYFYNVNGSDYNSTISIYQNNCSLTNSSCSDINARKFPTPTVFNVHKLYIFSILIPKSLFPFQLKIISNLLSENIDDNYLCNE